MVRPMTYPEMYPPDEEDFRPKAVVRTTFVDSIDRGAAEKILDQIASSERGHGRDADPRPRRGDGPGARRRHGLRAPRQPHHGQRRGDLRCTARSFPTTRAGSRASRRELKQGDDGAYVGFLGDEGDERIRAAYPGRTWERLAAIKARYDPENVFRLNQNVPPAAPGADRVAGTPAGR